MLKLFYEIGHRWQQGSGYVLKLLFCEKMNILPIIQTSTGAGKKVITDLKGFRKF
jgi:hypothetical protein